MQMRSLRRLAIMAAVFYLTACVALYAKQESILFPGASTPLVSSWQPEVGYPYEEMRLQSAKGLLYGVLWHAPDAKGTVLYSHGNGENIRNSQKYVSQFIAHGYNILIWDYRGYGLSRGEFGSQESMLADAESVYQWLSAKTGSKDIVFYGQSLGSGFAVYLAQKHPGHKVLLEAAYDNLTSVAQDHYPMFPATLILKYPMPSVEWVKGISTTIYMIHGSNDQVIPPRHPKALAKEAPSASLTMVQGMGQEGLRATLQYARWLVDAL